MARIGKYCPEIHAKAAQELIAGGALDCEVYDALGISYTTYYRWRAQHREFREATTRGHEIARDRVIAELFNRATGKTVIERRRRAIVVSDGKDVGEHVEMVEEETVSQMPGDVSAQIYWLNNRAPDEWRTVKATEISGPRGGAVQIEAAPEQRRAALEAFRLARGVLEPDS